MPITFQCQCGRKFRTGDENAGRSATCPDCRTHFVVPAASAVPAAAPGPAPILPPVPEEQPAAPPPAYPAESEEVTPVPRRTTPSSPYGWSNLDDPGEPDAPAPRRRPPYRRDDVRDRIVRRPPPSSNFMGGAGALAGIAMMIGAVVWFVAGLYFDIIFFYPPFLFIAGLVCFIRGLVAGRA